MRLLTELQRRNVIRMAALYVAAAWLFVQVAGGLIELGVLPATVGPWVIVVLAIGFPIALVASWFFELTPAGIVPDSEVADGRPAIASMGRRTDFVIIAILSAGLLVFAADKWWPRELPELSIAVLPFENMGIDAEQEYFSDGISEEILNLLAQIRELKVIARTSSFSFKGKNVDIATIAEQLNVRHVLEGSVRKDGDRVRITAQLIDARDSSHLWSQTYDRDLTATSLFLIQSDIARTITDRLRMTLTVPEEQRLASIPTENTEAYAAYLLGRDRLRDRQETELADAAHQFGLAVQLDPNFAGAWSGLADACFLYYRHSRGGIHDDCPAEQSDVYEVDLEPLARKAIELDPELGEAWISLGPILQAQVVQTPAGNLPLLREAIAAYKRGLELNPGMSQGYHWYALSLPFVELYPDPPHGWIEAWRERVWQSVIDKGLEVDPLSIQLHRMKTFYPMHSSTPEEAIWHAQRLIELAPDSPTGYFTRGAQSRRFEGRIDEAMRWFSRGARLGRDNNPLGEISLEYLQLGDYDTALQHNSHYLSVIERAPGYMNLERAIALLYLGRHDEAVDVFEPIAANLMSDRRNALRAIAILAGLDIDRGAVDSAIARYDEVRRACLEYEHKRDQHCAIELLRIAQLSGDEDQVRPFIDEFYESVVHPYIEAGVGFRGQDYRISYLALTAQHDEALDLLEAMSLGELLTSFMYTWQIARDYDATFDAIRDNPRFRAVFAKVETEMAKQLEHVRQMERDGEIVTLEELRDMASAAN